MNQPKDYMKYWKLIRKYAKAKYKLDSADLDMLFFLRSERIFKMKDFLEYEELFTWDKRRFRRLRDNGWIQTFRESGPKGHRVAGLYELTLMAKRAISDIYKKMEGGEFSENPRTNPLFKNDASFSDKVTRNYMKKINEAIQQGRCHEVE